MFACQESLVSQQAGLRAEKRREEKEKPPAKPGRKRKEPTNEDAEPACVSAAAPRRSRAKKSKGVAEPAGGSAADDVPKPVKKPAAKKPAARTCKGSEKAKASEEEMPKGKCAKGKGKGKGKSGDTLDVRKLKADQAYEKLIRSGADMKIPKLGDRKSFTLSAPGPDKSSVGVILYNDYFYVSKCIPPAASWPSSCSGLKVPMSFAFLFVHSASFFWYAHVCASKQAWPLHMSSCVALIPMDRWTSKVALLFLGIFLTVRRRLCCAMHGARPKSWLVGKAWLIMFADMCVCIHVVSYLHICVQCICVMWPHTPLNLIMFELSCARCGQNGWCVEMALWACCTVSPEHRSGPDGECTTFTTLNLKKKLMICSCTCWARKSFVCFRHTCFWACATVHNMSNYHACAARLGDTKASENMLVSPKIYQSTNTSLLFPWCHSRGIPMSKSI